MGIKRNQLFGISAGVLLSIHQLGPVVHAAPLPPVTLAATVDDDELSDALDELDAKLDELIELIDQLIDELSE